MNKFLVVVLWGMLQCHFSCINKNESSRNEARLAYASGEYDKAIHHAIEVISLDSNDSEMLGLYSRALIEAGRNAEALQILSRLMKVSGDSTLLCYRGTCLNELSRFEEAKDDFTNALEFDKSLSCAWFGRAKSNAGMGNYNQSIADIKEYMFYDSVDFRAWNILGMNYKALMQYDLAKKSYNKAIEIHPEDWVSYYNLAVAQTMQGDFVSALTNSKASLMRVNNDSRSMLNRERGKIFYLMNNLDSACYYWQQGASALDNESQDLLNQLCKPH